MIFEYYYLFIICVPHRNTKKKNIVQLESSTPDNGKAKGDSSDSSELSESSNEEESQRGGSEEASDHSFDCDACTFCCVC